MPENASFLPFALARHADGRVHELGRGAMGVTYKATDTQLGRPVALKVIAAAYLDDPVVRERFLAEARAAAHLHHPNVASVFHLRTEGGPVFYAMEFVEGENLEAFVVRQGPLPVRFALRVILQAAKGLAAAHERGLIHRDMKPANLMLARAPAVLAADDDSDTDDGLLVKVIDFGLAKSIEQSEFGTGVGLTGGGPVGTPNFMSPEQISASPGMRLDARTDIYSLGVTLWFLLTGKPVFEGTQFQILSQHMQRPPPLEILNERKVPSDVVALISAMLAKDREQRPGNHVALAGLIKRILRAGGRSSGDSSGGTTLLHAPVVPRRPMRRGVVIASAVAAVLVLGGVGWWLRGDGSTAKPPTATVEPAPEKSIAVLPFGNLSDERDSGFFAEGMQDDILTDLAKVSDLRVISRASTRGYPPGPSRNLREIARNLGVAHLLEGNVRRAGSKVRVSASLIRASNGDQLWADSYDRDLADVFGIQSEISRAIVAQLKARLSPAEDAALQERPTKDIAAYEVYVRAKDIIENFLHQDDQRASLERAVDLFSEAVRRDPRFLSAHCYLARAHSLSYSAGFDPSSARRVRAEAALAAARALRPESGELRLAQGYYAYHCERDYTRTRAELDAAEASLPNSPSLFILRGFIHRSQARWEEATRDLERGVTLDPRNTNAIGLLADNYLLTRDWAGCERWGELLRRAGVPAAEAERSVATAHFAATGDTVRLRKALAALPLRFDPGGAVTPQRVLLELADGDFAAAERVLASSTLTEFQDVDFSFYYPRAWYEALIARASGRIDQARAAFTTARAALVNRPRNLAEEPRFLAVLAQIDAGLGRKDDALNAAKRAVQMKPIADDAYQGPLVLQGLVQAYAWTGEKDAALEGVQTLLSVPGYLSYGYLRKDPLWAPLRGDPRFEALLAKAKGDK